MPTDDYFSLEAVQQPAAPGRFVRLADLPDIHLFPGIAFRAVLGENMLANFARQEPNCVVPVHAHEEEQLTFILEGEMEFDIGGEKRLMRVGDVAVMPAWVAHGGVVGPGGCYSVDIFNPPRAHLRAAIETQQRSLST